MMPGEQQSVLGAGQGDVEQSTFLVDTSAVQLSAVGVDDIVECLAVAHLGGVEHRYPVQPVPETVVCAVTAQQWRQVGRVV